jgi:hypothetical protein
MLSRSPVATMLDVSHSGFWRTILLAPAACTGIANGNNVSITCSSATDSQANPGFTCVAGYYLVNNTAPTADACVPCIIGNSNNVAVTCTNATDAQGTLPGFKCNNGFYFVNNVAPTGDACMPCPGIGNSNNVSLYCTGQAVCCCAVSCSPLSTQF